MAQVAGAVHTPALTKCHPGLSRLSRRADRLRCPGTGCRPEGLSLSSEAACVTFPALGGPLSSPGTGSSLAQML